MGMIDGTSAVDTNFAYALTLQNERKISLVDVATKLMNFKVQSHDQKAGSYELTNSANELFCIRPNAEGLQVGSYAFGYSSRSRDMNTVRFVKEHLGHKTDLEAIAFINSNIGKLTSAQPV